MARYRTLQEWEGLTGADKLTAPEHLLIDRCRTGKLCDLGNGTRPDGPDPARTIRADLLRYLILGGCEGCRVAEAGVQLRGAYIEGALDLDFAKAHGQTFLVTCRFEAAISALQCRLDLLTLSGSFAPGLNAQGAKVTGDVFLRNGFHATGAVSLAGATIGGQLDCKGGRFDNKGGDALNAQGAKVTGDVFLRNGFHATGAVSLSGATIGGQLSCEGGRFDNKGGTALDAQGAKVTGGVFLANDFHATGEVHLSGATIGGQLACEGGRFDNEGGTALNAQRLRVEASLIWRGATVPEGTIMLNAAHVGDLVDDTGSWPEPDKNGGRLLLDGFTYDRISGAFTDAPTRLAWLAKGSRWEGEFFPQPYAQLARVLREMGHDRAARVVMIEKERLLAQEQIRADREKAAALRAGTTGHRGDIGAHWLRRHLFRLWDRLIRILVGYGYAPQRALYWAVGTLVVLTVFYFVIWRMGGMVPNSAIVLTSEDWTTALAEDAVTTGALWVKSAPSAVHYETFWSGFYAADVFIPLVSFGQEAAWTATTKTTAGTIAFVVAFLAKGFGWFITALGAAAVGGIIRRD